MANKKFNFNSEYEAIMAILRAVGERLDTVAEMQKESDRRLKKQQEAAERRQEETDRQLRETSKEIKKLSRQVGGQGQRWGKIIESLVEGDLCLLMTEFLGVEIVDISRRVEVRDVEIDLVAVNTNTVVVVEVKTTLQQEDLDKFVSTKLNRFTELRPHYKGSKIYGVIAYVKVDSNAKEVVNYALSKGLIVIKAMRGTNHILNPKGHKPHNFHP